MNPQSEAEEKPSQPSQEGNEDSIESDVQQLIEAGTKKGFLTYDEIAEVISKWRDLSTEQYEKLLEMLTDAGIEIGSAEHFDKLVERSPDS